MFDVALNLDIIYTALLFFPGEDPESCDIHSTCSGVIVIAHAVV